MKKGPFTFSKISAEHPLYAHYLADQFKVLEELPDLDSNSTLIVSSDYGGEHNSAFFNTYSFLLTSSSLDSFKNEMDKTRTKFGMTSEYAYKNLSHGQTLRSLDDYLTNADEHIQGILMTISIDKSINTVFGKTKEEGQVNINRALQKIGCDKYKFEVAEKVLRICHPLAMLLAQTTRNGHKILWNSDKDPINANPVLFDCTKIIFLNALRMYTDNFFETIGVARTFDQKPNVYDDLLSLSDFAAGSIQDIIASEREKTSINELSKKWPGKKRVIEWMISNKNIMKINFLLEPKGSPWTISQVHLNPPLPPACQP